MSTVNDLADFQFLPVSVSDSGTLVLFEDEVEVKYEGDVCVLEHIRKKAGKVLIPSGVVILTNLRLVSIISKTISVTCEKIGWGVSLADVALVEDCSSSYFGSSTRLHIQMRTGNIEIGLKFLSKKSDKAQFLSQMQYFLGKKSWIIPAKPTVAVDKSAAFSVSTAGVAGILRAQEQNLKVNDALARDATADLDSLMKRAKEMASVIQRYASYAGDRADGQSRLEGSENTSEVGDISEIDAILQSIGIASPVTKFSAGRLYHKQLARQLADYLHDSNRLSRLGGMMTLTDIYGIFNRARGTELVSPDDFLKSAEIMGSLSLGITLVRFASGVIILRLDSLNEDALCQNILQLSKSNYLDIDQNGIYATLVAQHLNLSIVLSKEVLLIAENRGLLCRDDSIGGLAFFPNKFGDIS